MRSATVERKTSETQIELTLGLDGSGKRAIDTQVPFFTHMLDAFARHGLYDLDLTAKGDVEIDAHHVVEDVGLALGDAYAQALGDKRGIRRYGECTVPMDETLAVSAIDLSGRAHAVVDLKVKVVKVGDLQTELVHEFFDGFAMGARANVHAVVLYGRSSHHKIEAVFKAFVRALRVACAKDRRLARMLPSTKGLL